MKARIFLILLFLNLSLFSQRKTSGIVLYSSFHKKDDFKEVKYELNFNEVNSRFIQIKKDKSSKFKAEEDGSITITNSYPDSLTPQYYVDFKKRKIFSFEPLSFDDFKTFTSYPVIENMNFKWQLTNEEKSIEGYLCRKANLNFRGRQYEAWYTTAIAIPYGPWKFSGLPGIILSIKDSTGEIAFVATKIMIKPIMGFNQDFSIPKDKNYIEFNEYVNLKLKSKKDSEDSFRAKILSKFPRGATVKTVSNKDYGIEIDYRQD